MNQVQENSQFSEKNRYNATVYDKATERP